MRGCVLIAVARLQHRKPSLYARTCSLCVCVCVCVCAQWRDPRQLFGVGRYGYEAYLLFCRGAWHVMSPPQDKDLLRYYTWLHETGTDTETDHSALCVPVCVFLCNPPQTHMPPPRKQTPCLSSRMASAHTWDHCTCCPCIVLCVCVCVCVSVCVCVTVCAYVRVSLHAGGEGQGLQRETLQTDVHVTIEQ